MRQEAMSAALATPLNDPRRSQGPTLLAMPRSPAAKSADTSEFGPRDIFNALRYHLVLFLFLGSLVAAGLAFAAWTFFPAKYTTYSMLRVFANEQSLVDRGPNGQTRTEFGTYLSTQASLIKSHLIMNRALRQPVDKNGTQLVNLPMFQGMDDPISFLEEKIMIEFSDRSEIVKVAMTGDDAVQITAAVNAVTDAFLKEVETYRQFKQANYDKLLKTKSEREKELEELKKSYDLQFRPLAGNEAKSKSRQARMAKYIQLVNDEGRVQNELRRVREQIDLAKARQKQLDQPPPDASMPDLTAMVDRDEDVRKKVADIQRIDNYVTYHQRTARDKQSEHIKEYLRKLERERGELEELKRSVKTRLVKAYQHDQQLQQQKGPGAGTLDVMKLQNELDRWQIEERLVKDELLKYADLVQEEAAAGPPPEQMLMDIKLRNIADQVGRLQIAAENQKTELAADDRVKLYEKAHVPQQKEMKKQIAFTGAAGLGGFFLVGGLITLGEIRRQRIYSHRDRVFANLPLLGRIPEHGFVEPVNGADPDPNDDAGLAFREAIDRIKTLTLRQMDRRDMRSLLVTSPAPDEGKSILAWNLAAGMARTDFRVLYIDANLRRPTIHHHLNMPMPAGLCEVLRGERPLTEVALQTPVANLFCLSTGLPDEEARRSLDKPALAKLLEHARYKFDYVIIDGGALSESADPLCLAQKVDGVMLSLRTFRSRTPAAEQAMQQMQHLGASVVGVVLTDPTLRADEM
jgi:capsular exopolysaccharide synthesis family protein